MNHPDHTCRSRQAGGSSGGKHKVGRHQLMLTLKGVVDKLQQLTPEE